MRALLAAPWWVIAFFALGVFAAASVLISLFSSSGRRPGDLRADGVGPVSSRSFLVSLAGLVNAPLQAGGSAQLLDNGDAFLPAILDALRSASRSINFMVYIWEPGTMSDLIFAALVERAEAGVEVRVLLDGLGGLRAPDDDIERLRRAGGHVHHFRTATFGKLTRFHKRNHRRAIVVDGVIGFTGGAAVGDKWLGDARNPDEWRDSMTRVTGAMAGNLQSAFTEAWAYCSGEMLMGDRFYPLEEDTGGNGIGRHIHIASSPSSEEHPLRLFFLVTFQAARQRLWISTPYFVPDEQTRAAVAAQARGGVDVRILLPSQHTDARPIRQAGRSYFEELLRAGVRIYEYQPTMIHVKTVLVDDAWGVVGSANMDIRSKELNEENVLGILDRDFARQLELSFTRDLERAQEIHLEEWQRRGMGSRLLERFCVLFAEQY